MAQILVGHPLDTIKVRLQTQNRLLCSGEAQKYNSLSHCIKTTVREEGWRGFWKGSSSPMLGCIVYSAGLFFTYGQAKRLLNFDEENPTFIKIAAIGAITGVTSSFIECPVDMIKARLQS